MPNLLILLDRYLCGAEGGIRTPTGVTPYAPQAHVSTNSTTSASRKASLKTRHYKNVEWELQDRPTERLSLVLDSTAGPVIRFLRAGLLIRQRLRRRLRLQAFRQTALPPPVGILPGCPG